MSNSCPASKSLVLHSNAPLDGEVHLHVPIRCHTAPDAADPAPPAPSRCARYFAVKSVVDPVLTALLMLVALPLMAVVSLAIILCDGRPVFYRQTRVGKNGRVFRIWKFRTMCRHAESVTGAVWSSDCDPRVTALGRWLRCSHLDELPQFFNVLAGDMNLIGPRPERPEFVRELLAELPRYADRLGVRPGITGLAQLRFGYDQSLADVRRKTLLDSRYVRTASLLLDMQILLFTIPYVARQVCRRWRGERTPLAAIRRRGAVVSPLTGLTSRERRGQPAATCELNPHIALLPDTGIDFGTSHASAESWR
jgi:lipopolysaccharide/colanic/teichoic acid biosynthesis glycosyltransferase